MNQNEWLMRNDVHGYFTSHTVFVVFNKTGMFRPLLTQTLHFCIVDKVIVHYIFKAYSHQVWQVNNTNAKIFMNICLHEILFKKKFGYVNTKVTGLIPAKVSNVLECAA